MKLKPKNLLLLHDDPFLTAFYSEKFEEAGFDVWVAYSIDAAIERLDAEPDVILIDPLMPGEGEQLAIEAIRAHATGGRLPVLALPTTQHLLTTRIEQLPGVQLLKSVANPLGEAIKTVMDLFQPGVYDAGKIMLIVAADERWKERALIAVQRSLVEMRQTHHELTRDPGDRGQIWAYLRAIHHFARQTTLLNGPQLLHFANAVESLVFGLDQFPERVDPMALRTLSQANDFLAALLTDRAYSRIPDFQSATVMVIEDEAPARELIIAAMDLVALKATGAGAPDDGLAALAAQPWDLVFLDINLPEMNGFEVCNKLRALPLHERTPVVFLTGMTSFNNRVQSNLSGGNDFICKPFNVAELGVKALMWVMKGRLGMN